MTPRREESWKARPHGSPGVTVSRSPAPRKRARLAGLVGALLLVLAGTASAVAIPSLSLDRDESPPGALVPWTASGFDGCLPIDDVQTDGTLALLWDGDQELVREELAGGSAAGTFVVPESAQLTEHRVTAQCVSDGALGDTSNLLVTAPREPDVAVPNVVGLTRAEAEQEIRAAKLVPGVVTGTGDFVEDQQPAAGLLVQPLSRVDLDLGTPPVEDVVVVPDVVGLSVASARAALESAGLLLGSIANPGGGNVQEQRPLAGQEAAPGDSVAVTLGLPPTTRVRVPDLRGLKLADVPAVLDRRDLELGVVTGTGGTVRGQRPEPGGLVPVRSEVNVSVQSGRRPVRVVVVPDLVGLTADEARDLLSSVGLFLSQPDGDGDGDGTISSQQPVARTHVAVGSTVTVIVEDDSPWAMVAGIGAATLLVAAAGATGGRALKRRGDQRWVAKNLALDPVSGRSEEHVAERSADESPQTRVLRLTPHRDLGTQTVQEVEP
ncbi:PASTA domain-containing protein [Nocardioides cavernae]|uniref:PASTA domain-containing protein n=1 Tax=Nocardioides cavernae TaxID=1921566 RepID=A0ABR8NM03_9ACTN|nr:PASTA domain-containing protein [Nocardioides cavernae]MBD3927469.1 PASTA domain-containing protein [Nocardioides cavernae]MBM7513210.1 beta-lactam-binding protein with PASTA domain [Nocardioides cavernae]